VDVHKEIQVRNVIRERLDGREIVDLLISLQRAYNPEIIGIEEMQVSKSIGPFLREEMHKTGVYINIYPLKHGNKDKLSRTRSIQARMRTHSVTFDKDGEWYQTFEDELTRFPRDAHDDQVDAFAYLGLLLDKLVEAPTKEEYDEEVYLDERRNRESNDDGRNAITGY
jgi:predicted phage terminase large subunit-like protein